MGLAGAGLAVAIAGLGYGVYSSQEAQAQQKRAIDEANRNSEQARRDQQTQYQNQLQQEQQAQAANLAQEAQTKADTQAAQQQALAAEQAAIGTNTTTLSNSLSAQEKQALAAQDPLIQDRLNAMGIANSGAYAEALAKYQRDLDANAQNQIANYQIGAQGQLTQNTNAATAEQVKLAEQNALLNIQNQEQNMAQNFATTNANNANDTAYQQYITNLELGKAQADQSAANSYVGLAGGIGSGLLNYYGSQNSNPSLQALQMYGNVNSYANSNPNLVSGGSYNPRNTNAENSYTGFYS